MNTFSIMGERLKQLIKRLQQSWTVHFLANIVLGSGQLLISCLKKKYILLHLLYKACPALVIFYRKVLGCVFLFVLSTFLL